MPDFSSDIALCNDIVAELNQRDWLLPFTAERTWLPEWTQRGGELETLQVSVNPWIEPTGELIERDDSGDEDEPEQNPQLGMWTTWSIDITFCQRLTQHSREQVDQLANVTEQVRQFLVPQRFQLDDGRLFESTMFQYLARFDPSTLNRVRDKGQVYYTGIFLAAFRVPFKQLGG